MARSRTVIVAGAGIGGLTAALALARKGFRVVVVEQAERPGGDRRRHPALAQRNAHPRCARPRRAPVVGGRRARGDPGAHAPRPRSRARAARRRRRSAATARPTGSCIAATSRRRLPRAVRGTFRHRTPPRRARRGFRAARQRRHRASAHRARRRRRAWDRVDRSRRTVVDLPGAPRRPRGRRDLPIAPRGARCSRPRRWCPNSASPRSRCGSGPTPIWCSIR